MTTGRSSGAERDVADDAPAFASHDLDEPQLAVLGEPRVHLRAALRRVRVALAVDHPERLGVLVPGERLPRDALKLNESQVRGYLEKDEGLLAARRAS